VAGPVSGRLVVGLGDRLVGPVGWSGRALGLGLGGRFRLGLRRAVGDCFRLGGWRLGDCLRLRLGDRCGFRLGGSIQYTSGLPYSLLFRNTSAATSNPEYPVSHKFYTVRTIYTTHQRNDQRNAPAWNFDAKIAKEMNLARGMNLQLTAEIFNLFGENTYRIYNNFTNSGQQLNGENDATRAFGRQYQLGMRLAF